MSIIRYFIILFIILTFSNQAIAEEIKKIGKFKDWEVMIYINESEKTCFAQSSPVLQSPKKNGKI